MFSTDAFWGSTGAIVTETLTNPFSTDVSTLDTLRIMSSLATRDSHLPSIQSLAHNLCSDCSSLQQCARAIWFFVSSYIVFRPHESMAHEVMGAPKDGIDRQVLISPASLLGLPSPEGDCAVYSTFTAALLKALGIPSAFRITASDKEEPERWSHVYVVAKLGDEEMVLDTSHGDYPGWETKTKFREMDYPV